MTWADDRAEAVDAAKRLADAVDALHTVDERDDRAHALEILSAEASGIGVVLARMTTPQHGGSDV